MPSADISFLPQLESRGMKFSDNGTGKDPILILKNHGFNYVRLRIFNNPARDSGYSPKWHGTLDDLRDNMNDLVRRYNKGLIVAEYSALKEEVNKLAFELPNGKGKGTCILEPLNTWESFFDKDGNSNKYLKMYDEISKEYISSK